MKNFFTILSIVFLVTAHSQFNKYGFDTCLKENGDQITPFAILNDGQATIDNVKKSGMLIKKITTEYIYVTTTPNTIANLYRNKQIKDFYYTFTKPVLLNDSSRVHHNVNQVHNGTNGLDASYTGKNVIIGYIDTGCDFQHPDFKDANGNSRIIRYWDLNLPFDATRTPTAYGYGQVFDSIDINNMIPVPDCSSGHGTTVAGAGSGNGLSNGKNAGMSPDSKIVIVDFNFGINNWTLAVSDAVDYIFNVADQYNLPAVVNISLGQYFGSHDGNDPAAEFIEGLLDEKPGRVVVSSAGNGGDFKNFHIQSVVDNTPSFVWLKNTPSGYFGPNTAFFDLWGSAGQVEGINFSFSAVNPLNNFQTRGSTTTYNVLATIGSTIVESIRNANGDTIAKMEIYTGVQNGAYNMFGLITRIDSTAYYISFNTSGTGKFDAWTGASFAGYEFVETIPTAATFPNIVNYIIPDSLQSIVSDWNCSEKVISVANMQNRTSYTDINGTFHDVDFAGLPAGQLSASSSIGPNRLGFQKPDVTAAGDGSFSPVPMCYLQDINLQVNILQDGWHGPNGGTSMASPVLAGIAGLYLEKCPKSTYQNFKDDLIATAYQDGFTGLTPNFAYGYGKADALALLLRTDYAINILGGTEYCGTPFNLSVNSSDALDTYSWSDNSTNTTFTVNSTGNYSVITTNYKGCKSSATTTITSGTPVTPTISINTPTISVCQGQTVMFTATSTNGGGSPTYQWMVNGTIVGANSPSFSSSSLNNNDVISCQLISSISCITANNIASNTITMNIDPVLNPNLTISQSANQICAGDPVNFSSVVTGAGTNPVYKWFVNNELVGTNSPSFSSTALQNGDAVYCVVFTNSSCAVTNQDVSNILVTTVVENATISLTGNTLTCLTPANTYQWYNCSNNEAIVGATSASFSPSNSGSYYVEATLNNCVVRSNCQVVASSGLTDLGQSSIFIYPNPTKDIVNIHNGLTSNYKINLKTVSGQLVGTYTSSEVDYILSVEYQSDGLYFIEILDESGSPEVFKLIKK